jgi:O-antigen/teichoic acid export membrane protein
MNAEPGGDVLDTARAGTLVIRGGALRVVGYGLGTLATVASTAILLRHLSVADAGRYTTVISLIAIVGGLVDAGMTNIGIREWAARRGADRERTMRDLLGVRLVITLVGAASAVVFAVLAGYSAEMVAGTALAGAGLILLIFANTLQVPLQAELQLGTVAAIDVLRNVLTAALVSILALAGTGIVPLLAVPLPVGLVLVAVAAWVVRARMRRRPALDLARWRALLTDALPSALATTVAFVYVYLAVFLLGFVSTEHEVGIYSAAFRVFIVLVGLAGLVQQSAFPVLARSARDDRDRLSYATQRLLDGSLVLGGLVGLATAVGAPVAIEIMAGPRYSAAVPALRLQGAALMMTFLAVLGGFALLSMHRYRAVLIVNALGLVTSVVCVLTLGAAHGATGAGWANLAGETVVAVAGLVAVARGADGVPLTFGTALRVVPALAAGLAAAWLVPGGAVVETAVAVVVAGAGMLLLRAVPEELVQALRR